MEKRINKKGFTLMEIIAAVAIIGIIIAIAVVAYSNTADRSLKRLYEAKIKLIETKAESWATDNNITDAMTITVNRLIVEGYLDADKDSEKYAGGIVESPVDKKELNCKLINIEVNKGNVRAEYTEGENCDIINVGENDARLYLVATGEISGEIPSINEVLPWKKEKIVLSINPEYEYDLASVKWYLKKGLINGSEGKNSYLVESTYLFDDIVRVSINVNNKNEDGSANWERRTAYLRVRIDFEEPVIDEVKSSGNGTWVNDENDNKVIIKATDLGSGMSEYWVSKDNTDYAKVICNKEYPDGCEFNIKETGEYKVKVFDKVGNMSEESSPISIKVDTSELGEPEVTINTSDGGTNESGEWTNKCVSFKLETEYSESGIARWEYKVGSGSYKVYGNSRSNPYVTSQICEDQNQTYCFRGINNAGTVSKESCVEVKIDRTPPWVSIASPVRIFRTSSYVFANYFLAGKNYGDNLNNGVASGIKTVYVSVGDAKDTFKTDGTFPNAVTYRVTDEAGNVTEAKQTIIIYYTMWKYQTRGVTGETRTECYGCTSKTCDPDYSGEGNCAGLKPSDPPLPGYRYAYQVPDEQGIGFCGPWNYGNLGDKIICAKYGTYSCPNASYPHQISGNCYGYWSAYSDSTCSLSNTCQRTCCYGDSAPGTCNPAPGMCTG